jgi:hypothetical protein
MKLQSYGAAILLSLHVVGILSGKEDSPRKVDPPSKSYVRPIDFGALAERFRALPDRNKALIHQYLQGAQRYVLTREDGAFPDKGTEHWRNIAERAHGAAVLAALADQWPDELRERCRRQSVVFVGAKVFCRKGADWFWALRHDARGVHDAFISLPDEIVVVMAAAPAAAVKSAGHVDSLVSVEKPHKAFTVFYHGGQATFHYGQKAWDRSDKIDGLALWTKWVNLADSIGYVAVNLSQDPSWMVLPKAGVRGGLSLHHVERPVDEKYFLTVALPNQDHQRTEAMAAKVTGTYGNGIMTCLVPPYFVWSNFSDQARGVQLPHGMEVEGPVTSPPNSVGILRMGHENHTWSPLQ